MDIAAVSEPTARDWYERFRLNLPQDKLADIRLSGTVQADEFYRKGYAIIGAKQVEGKKKLVLQFLPKESVDRADAVLFAEQHIKAGSKLHTDGAMIYKGLANWWPVDHRYECHNRWEFELTSDVWFSVQNGSKSVDSCSILLRIPSPKKHNFKTFPSTLDIFCLLCYN
jgi:hypothetical protein